MITQARLQEVLHYNPDTGVFTWRVTKSYRAVAGSVAGNVAPIGYHRIRIDNVSYWSHRLAWLYTYGSFPVECIDHINRVKTDNRLVNLRAVTKEENGNNRDRSRRTSALKGVHKEGSLFRAMIGMDGVTYHLGYFHSEAEAAAAYQAAKSLRQQLRGL